MNSRDGSGHHRSTGSRGSNAREIRAVRSSKCIWITGLALLTSLLRISSRMASNSPRE